MVSSSLGQSGSRTPGDFVVKSKLFPCSGSAALGQLIRIHEKGRKLNLAVFLIQVAG